MRLLFGMKKGLAVFICISGSLFLQAQDQLRLKNNTPGTLQIGFRNTYSLFNNGALKNTGMGTGGQFNLLLLKNLDTEWFADYIRGNEGDAFTRTDAHIGWSVAFIPGDHMTRIQPYLLAGHCFDFSRIVSNEQRDTIGKRWSGAVQGGIGFHLNMTPRFNFTFASQYMLHLGNEVEASVINSVPTIIVNKSSSPEGHLLLTLSMNYKLSDLW